MKKIKKVLSLLRINWRTMAEFEILYKFLSLCIFTPVFWGIFQGIMKITGYEYLTIENILSFLWNPLTLAALLVLLICMAVYAMIDIGAVIFLLDQSYQGEKADLTQTVRYAQRLSAADHFSIEASSITEKIVSDVHNGGKEIYGWTVNTEESINRMIDLNVDNIITDHVTLAKECIYLSKTSDVISEYVKWLWK